MKNEVNTKQDPILSSNKNTYDSPRYISKKEMKHLATIAKWTKVISIATFIYAALVILSVILAIIGSAIRIAPGCVGEYVVYIVVGIVVGIYLLFPATLLYRASKSYKHTVDTTDASTLTEGLSNSAKFWKFNGVCLIICVVFAIALTLVSI